MQIELIHKFRDVYNFSLFVVGDTKQCIYCFRGANGKAFDVLKSGCPHIPWHMFTLSKNYRTDKNLLEAFNVRFLRWAANGLLEYCDKDRLIGVKDYHSGLPERSFFYPETRWSDELQKKDRLRQILNALINDPEVGAKNQVAILVRENKQVEKIKKICSQIGIGVATDVGGVLYKLQPAIDLYKLVKAL